MISPPSVLSTEMLGNVPKHAVVSSSTPDTPPPSCRPVWCPAKPSPLGLPVLSVQSKLSGGMIALSPLLLDTNLRNKNARINTSSLEQMASSPMHLHYCPFIMGDRFRDLIPGGGLWLLDNRAWCFFGGDSSTLSTFYCFTSIWYRWLVLMAGLAHISKGCTCFFFRQLWNVWPNSSTQTSIFWREERGWGVGSPGINPCPTICLCLPPGGLTEMTSQHVCAPSCGCWFLLLMIITSDIYCLYFSLAGSRHLEIRKGFDCDTIIDASQSLKMFFFFLYMTHDICSVNDD